MLPYWCLFLVAAGMAVRKRHGVLGPYVGSRGGLWGLFFVILGVIIGLRHEVGGDWYNYLRILELARRELLPEALTKKDPAYALINWFAANRWGDIYLVNSVCALFFSWGLYSFCRVQPRPWLAVVVAMPYLITVVAMGYARQGVAIGLAMLALVALGQGRVLRFLLWMILAASFHKTAVVLMPLAVFFIHQPRFRWLARAAVVLMALLLYYFLLRDSVSHYYESYVRAGYDSSGATIRIAMNALPALVFLRWRRRFALSISERWFWTVMSLFALGFVVLLYQSTSSTAVDRIALYWIPLQIFVWSRFPDAMAGTSLRVRTSCVWGVIGYSGAVLFTWLFFAVHAFAWVPYRFYPWVVLMEWLRQ